MTLPSRTQSTQFTIGVHQPLAQGGEWLDNVSVDAETYQHVVSALGGFDSCEFSLAGDTFSHEEWLEEGLGRHVEVYDDAMDLMWEGFVNEIAIYQGSVVVRRGALVDIANRTRAVYSQIDFSTFPPTLGLRLQTAQAENTASQTKYGIWHKILSLAGATDTNALILRNTFLEEHSRPETSSDFTGGINSMRAVISCLGYWHTLNYPYTQTTVTGGIDLDAKIKAVLTAHPNSWIASDYSRIAANTISVAAWENEGNLGVDIIRGLTAMGDACSNRYTFGIYEGRQAVYAAVPTEHAYEFRLADPGMSIRNTGGGIVQPWQIRPARWMFFSDFLVGFADPGDLRDDPRMLFIESAIYRGGDPVPILEGGKTATLRQKLARLGLGGLNG